MATYAILFNWTEQGVKNFKDSPGRVESVSGAWAEAGVRIVDIYWTIGPYDLVGIVEATDDETLTAALLNLAAQGNVRTTTLRAFSRQEFPGIVERAG